MKKIVFSVLTLSMLLSTGAFAATKLSDANNTKTVAVSTVQESGLIRILTTDPH